MSYIFLFMLSGCTVPNLSLETWRCKNIAKEIACARVVGRALEIQDFKYVENKPKDPKP